MAVCPPAPIAEAYREFFADPEDLSCHIIVNAMGFDHVVHRAMDAVAQRHDNCRALLQVPLDRTSVRLATDYRDNILNLDTYYSFLYYDVSLVFDEEEGRKYNLPLVAYAIGAYSAANFVRAPAAYRYESAHPAAGRASYPDPARAQRVDQLPDQLPA